MKSSQRKIRTKEIHEAIVNDSIIREFQNLMMKIYSYTILKTMVIKNKEAIWIDETNHPMIEKIREQIQVRKDQIIKAYN